MINKTQTKPIEERLELAKLELVRTQKEVERCESLKKKKEDLKRKFAWVYSLSPLELQHENLREPYGITSFGAVGLGSALPLAKKDLALSLLYALNYQDVYPDAQLNLLDKISAEKERYIDMIWNRRISEEEYNSIVNATEHFLGRYIQRVKHRREEEKENLPRLIRQEELEYAKRIGKIIPENPAPKKEIHSKKTLANIIREYIFGGKK